MAQMCTLSGFDDDSNQINHLLTESELQTVYNMICKGGYTSEIDRATYADYIGTDFIRKIEADKDNNRDAPIWVWSAGNDQEQNGTFLASLPAVIGKAEDYWLSTVAINYSSSNSQYRIAGYSSRCGQTKRYCLGATVGGSKWIADGDTESNNSGTSAASPVITGGLAVIKEKFPSKDRRWARTRMLATASHDTADGKKLRDEAGNVVTPDAQGYSDMFGRGIMRLDLALLPVGRSTLSTSGPSLGTAQQYDVKNSFIRSSAVFGDGFKKGFSAIDTLKFDTMGAEFAYNMGDKVYTKSFTDTSNFLHFKGQNISHTPTAYHIGSSNLSFVDTKPHTFKDLDYTENAMPFTPEPAKNTPQPVRMSYQYTDNMAVQVEYAHG